MPLTKIWIHLVFSTKYRHPHLTEEIRQKLFDHIRENAISKKIHLKSINGYVDHVHVLLRLKPTQTLSKTVQLIKGESSYWINSNKFTREYFEWQDEYFAVSVAETNLANVIAYIENQEKHHAQVSFNDEYSELLKKHELAETI